MTMDDNAYTISDLHRRAISYRDIDILSYRDTNRSL